MTQMVHQIKVTDNLDHPHNIYCSHDRLDLHINKFNKFIYYPHKFKQRSIKSVFCLVRLYWFGPQKCHDVFYKTANGKNTSRDLHSWAKQSGQNIKRLIVTIANKKTKQAEMTFP